jgi:hypothetical protein
VDEAKSVYPLMGISANVALVVAGAFIKFTNSALAHGSQLLSLRVLVGPPRRRPLPAGHLPCPWWQHRRLAPACPPAARPPARPLRPPRAPAGPDGAAAADVRRRPCAASGLPPRRKRSAALPPPQVATVLVTAAAMFLAKAFVDSRVIGPARAAEAAELAAAAASGDPAAMAAAAAAAAPRGKKKKGKGSIAESLEVGGTEQHVELAQVRYALLARWHAVVWPASQPWLLSHKRPSNDPVAPPCPQPPTQMRSSLGRSSSRALEPDHDPRPSLPPPPPRRFKKVLKNSPKIRNLALLVMSYGVGHRLFEFAWKGQLRVLHTSMVGAAALAAARTAPPGLAWPAALLLLDARQACRARQAAA